VEPFDETPSEEWSRLRRWSIERRRLEVEERLKQPAHLPRWLDELLAECREEFTPRQVEALVYRYGFDLTLQEAADALGLNNKQTFRKRLDQAKAKVVHLRGEVLWELPLPDVSPEQMADYVFPLVERQRRWERAADRLYDLVPV
jgi:DNA-directed RNA polymerase specialized sigma24 family protein